MQEVIIMIVCKIFERDYYFDLFKIIGIQTAWEQVQYVVVQHLK